MATAVFTPTTYGTGVSGTVILTTAGAGGVQFQISVSGLTANSVHGIHVHNYGDISWDNGTSAGEHFNPFNEPHGCPPDVNRHVGDLGNYTADSNGNITATFVDTLATLAVTNNASIGKESGNLASSLSLSLTHVLPFLNPTCSLFYSFFEPFVFFFFGER